jgi:hypothetical protein
MLHIGTSDLIPLNCFRDLDIVGAVVAELTILPVVYQAEFEPTFRFLSVE